MTGVPRLELIAHRHANATVHGTGVLQGRESAGRTGRHEHEKNSDHESGKVSHRRNIASSDFPWPRNLMHRRGIDLKKVGTIAVENGRSAGRVFENVRRYWLNQNLPYGTPGTCDRASWATARAHNARIRGGSSLVFPNCVEESSASARSLHAAILRRARRPRRRRETLMRASGIS